MGSSLLKVGLVTLTLFQTAALCRAQPIVYSFSGTGSGNVAGTPFASVAFSIQVSADIAGVVEISSGVFSVIATSSSIQVAGIGSGTFTTGTRVFDNQNVAAAGFARSGTQTLDLLDLFEPPFATYDLRGSFGPVFEPTPQAVSQFLNVPSTLGSVTFTAASNVTFVATVVPEPSAAALTGAAAAASLRWRRRRAKC